MRNQEVGAGTECLSCASRLRLTLRLDLQDLLQIQQ